MALTRELTGAEIVCESLLKEGVDVLFGLPGGAVLPFFPGGWTFWALRERRVVPREFRARPFMGAGFFIGRICYQRTFYWSESHPAEARGGHGTDQGTDRGRNSL